MPRSFFAGLAARARSDATGAETAFTAARIEIEMVMREQRDYAQALSVLGMSDAALCHREDAIRESRRAVELVPVTKVARAGRAVPTNLTIINARTCDRETALKQS